MKNINRSVSVSRQASTKNVNASLSSGGRSTSVPRSVRTSRTTSSMATSGNREIISDMTFLNQHFYTDAGVHLPIKDVPSENKDLIPLTEDKKEAANVSNDSLTIEEKIDDLDEVEKALSTANITDDVKVNLRKMSKKTSNLNKRYSHSEIPMPVGAVITKNKRHSSIHSVSEFAKNNPTNKRRSLNITSKEISKIPIILKTVEGPEDKKDTKNDEKSITNKKLSNLPIPQRRKQS